MSFFKHLLTPEVEDRIPIPNNLLGGAVINYVVGDMLSGENTTLADRAAFIALPFVVSAAAEAGAEDGARPQSD